MNPLSACFWHKILVRFQDNTIASVDQVLWKPQKYSSRAAYERIKLLCSFDGCQKATWQETVEQWLREFYSEEEVQCFLSLCAAESSPNGLQFLNSPPADETALIAIHEQDTMNFVNMVLQNDPKDPHYSGNICSRQIQYLCEYQALEVGEPAQTVEQWLKQKGYSEHEVTSFFQWCERERQEFPDIMEI